MSEARIVVVGSVNTDMVVKSERIPAPGETVTGGQFFMPAGGKGANQAVAAARLGAQVTLVAKVGDDVFGRQAIENFQKEGIRTDHVVLDPQSHTGVALILVDRRGENSISVAPGANSRSRRPRSMPRPRRFARPTPSCCNWRFPWPWSNTPRRWQRPRAWR